MPLSIYLDDCLDWNLLITLLCNAGHTVISPRDVGTSRADDDVHLEFATQNGCALLTKDIKDFENLHTDWQSQGRPHHGIFLVHYEGDVTKDMSYHDIVRAIGNLLASGVPIANEIHRLNHWR
jgi:predicted nuclease of predicted toxin-antitoxin system